MNPVKFKYPDPLLHYVAITAIIHKNGKYLITKRASDKKAFPGKWTVPGGRISREDYIHLPKTTPSAWYGTVEKTLKREVKEETGLDIDNIRFLIDMTLIRGDQMPVVVLSFYGDYKSGKVRLDQEAVDYAWVTTKEAEKYPLIEGIFEEIVMVDKLIKGADPKAVKFEPRKY